ncbi:hypothetical protein CLU79DRAFT_745227 [Phycomyces nitens]|nr:hypothetical protein CLU79DRAFT_745227 [Phycomyces nitens]
MAAVQESSYRGFLKPKFWQRSKVDIAPIPKEAPKDTPKDTPKETAKQSFRPFKKPVDNLPHISEVYELSMVSDTGVYIPPIEEKIRDHWVDISQPPEFDLPSPECLTTALGGPHEFFTPSAVALRSSSSLSLNEDDLPSLMSNSSRRSSSDSLH